MIEKILQFLIGLLSRWQNRESLKLGGAKRSNLWPAFRKKQIELRGGKCELCDSTKTLELHHVESFASNPSRELDPTNVLVLCESNQKGVVCHRFFGHLSDYRKINPEVVSDAKIWRDKIINRPK